MNYTFKYYYLTIETNSFCTSTKKEFNYDVSLSEEKNQSNLEEILFSNIENQLFKSKLSDDNKDAVCYKEFSYNDKITTFKELFTPLVDCKEYKKGLKLI